MTTPLDELAEYIGPNGPGSDTEVPLFKALWEECSTCIGRSRLHPYGEGVSCSPCNTTGYTRRSRAEAALQLPDAVAELHAGSYKGIEIGYSHYKYPGEEFWVCTLKQKEDGRSYWLAEGQAANWLDALSAALLAEMKGLKP